MGFCWTHYPICMDDLDLCNILKVTRLIYTLTLNNKLVAHTQYALLKPFGKPHLYYICFFSLKRPKSNTLVSVSLTSKAQTNAQHHIMLSWLNKNGLGLGHKGPLKNTSKVNLTSLETQRVLVTDGPLDHVHLFRSNNVKLRTNMGQG